MIFEYFQGPEEDMSCLCEEETTCSLCGKTAQCFHLDFAYCPELGDETDDKFGCYDCLTAGKFEFRHDTDVGFLDE